MESTGRQSDVASLISILQLAYSGELAAALAYRGHWHSVNDPEERSRIKTIEDEEWHHRQLVGELLRKLGAGPRRLREIRAMIIGGALGIGCHLIGRFAPMYGAGRLESHNIVEYETAARLAHFAGRSEFVDCLLTMAEVEWEHEHYFRQLVEKHPLSRRVKVWAIPPAKENIRSSFEDETTKYDALINA